jgi:hypothetical protein
MLNSVKKSTLPILTVIILLISSIKGSSQIISRADKKTLEIKEDSLQQIASFMILDTLEVGQVACLQRFCPNIYQGSTS